jgi:hypothetical protein
MQTPPIWRPIRGRISGRPHSGCTAGMAAPQFEQKWALGGNPVPQR